MKIAILSFYSGINERGVERWVSELGNGLSGKNEITVYQNKPLKTKVGYKIVTSDLKYEDVQPDLLLQRFFLDYKSLKVLGFVLKIMKNLFRGNYDIIIPTDGGWEPAIIRLTTWLQRKKMVIVGHAGMGFDDANNLWSFPDVFVGLSMQAKSWAKKVNPFVRTEYIPNGVDLNKFNLNILKKDLKLNKPLAVCVSALEKGKRIGSIIEAVSKVKGLSLLVCGRGELKEEIGDLGDKLLNNRFKMAEYSFDEMPGVYRNCDLLLSASLPSYSFEMVLLEAMACGLPVIANNDPIRREIVGDAGLLTNPEDVNEFSTAINKALKTNWGSKPADQAKKFSWEVVSAKYNELFESLIKT